MHGFSAAPAAPQLAGPPLLLPLLVLHVHVARAALSVMPQHSDGIVMQLRSAIMLDEKDLTGPLPPTTCSSLDDGPYCDALRLRNLHTRGASSRSNEMFLAVGDMHNNAQFVVDGVLSHRLQMRNKGAFDWSMETYRTFNTHVSRVVSDALTGGTSETEAISRLGSARNSARKGQSGAQCFRLEFHRLPPFSRAGAAAAAVPHNFSAGLPQELAASWDGLWEAETGASPYPHGHSLHVPWRTQLILRTSLGYLRFAQPVILRRMILALPESMARGDVHSWSEGSLICGRHEKKQKWCVGLDHVVFNAVAAADEAAAQGAPYQSSGLLYGDVGNSIHAIDELAFIALPADTLRLAMVEVVATQPSHPSFAKVPGQQRVVLLRRATAGGVAAGNSGQSGGNIGLEPVLTMVSRDAVLWDLNEVLRHHMQLKPTSSQKESRHKGRKQALHSFQDMLKELKAGKLLPPPGVTLSRLKKEVVALVKSTKEIQDDDVLLHSKIDSLLQQRLQDNVLDGLLTLQAYWQRGDTSSAVVHESERVAASVLADGRISFEKEQQPDVSSDDDSNADAGLVVEGAPGASEETEELWTDDAAEAMQHASEELERKSAEIREKRKKQGKSAMDIINMDLSGGTIELKVQGGDIGGEALGSQDLMEKIKQMVTTAMQQQSSGSGDTTAQETVAEEFAESTNPEEAVTKVTELLSKNMESIQEALRSSLGESMEKLQMGKNSMGGKPEKVKFHMFTMDENGQVSGDMTKMFDSMMQNAQNVEEGEAGVTTVEAGGDISEVLRSMLSSTVRRAAQESEGSSDDEDVQEV